jgi:hypothetical protein
MPRPIAEKIEPWKVKVRRMLRWRWNDGLTIVVLCEDCYTKCRKGCELICLGDLLSVYIRPEANDVGELQFRWRWQPEMTRWAPYNDDVSCHAMRLVTSSVMKRELPDRDMWLEEPSIIINHVCRSLQRQLLLPSPRNVGKWSRQTHTVYSWVISCPPAAGT